MSYLFDQLGFDVRRSFSLRLEPIAGSVPDDLFVDAVRIGRQFGLGWVTFEANDFYYACYPSGRILRFTMPLASARGRWEKQLNENEWKYFPPTHEAGSTAPPFPGVGQ